MSLRIGGYDNSPRSIGPHDKLYRNSFQINGRSAPDNVYDQGLGTFDRSGVGIFDLVFPAGEAPSAVICGWANVDVVGCYVEYTGYNTSTRTASFQVCGAGLGSGGATGSITCVAKADLADTDYFTIDDGYGTVKLYEFDTAGNGGTAGRAIMDVSAATTAASVAAIVAAAIETYHPTLIVTDNEDGTIDLEHRMAGAQGNATITENVADAGFSVSGLSGGSDGFSGPAEPDGATVSVFLIYEE